MESQPASSQFQNNSGQVPGSSPESHPAHSSVPESQPASVGFQRVLPTHPQCDPRVTIDPRMASSAADPRAKGAESGVDVMGGTENLSSAKATASNDLLDMDMLSAGPASTGRPTDSANDFFAGISSGGSQGGEGGPTSTGKPDHTDMFSGIGGAGSASALGTSSGPGSVAGRMRSDFFGEISAPPSNKGGLDTDITRRSQKSIRHICDVVG
eukprot:786702_1